MSDEILRTRWMKCRNDLAEVRVELDELAQELRVMDLMDLSKKICEDEDSCERTLIRLASILGMEQELKQLKNGSKIFLLLSMWRDNREGSTVRVLIDAMEAMCRKDCVEYIENIARFKYVRLLVRLHVKTSEASQVNTVLLKADQVPERLPLRVFVRISVQDYIVSSYPTARGSPYCYKVELKKLGDLEWDTPSGYYVGRQVDLILCRLSLSSSGAKSISNAEPGWLEQMTKEEKRKGHVFEHSRSNTAYVELTFGYCDQQTISSQLAPAASLSAEAATLNIRGRYPNVDLRDESISADDEATAQNHNHLDIVSLHSAYSDDLPTSSQRPGTLQVTDEEELLDFDLKPSLDTEGLEESVLTSKPSSLKKDEGYSTVESWGLNQLMNPQYADVYSLLGFRTYSKIKETDRRAMGKREIEQHFKTHKINGCYLIRPSQTGTQPFTLTFGFNDRVYNISIVHQEDGRFSLFDKSERSFGNIGELIEYYKNNDIKNGMRLSVPVPE